MSGDAAGAGGDTAAAASIESELAAAMAEMTPEERAEFDALPGRYREGEDPDQKLTMALIRETCLTGEERADRDKAAESLFNLKILRLSWQRIPKIENLDAFTHVADLYLQYNRIKVIENLDFFDELTFLSLSNNAIERVENVSHLSTLEFLDLSANKISAFPPPGTFPRSLSILNLSDNPICMEDDYRMRILVQLPHLRMLDHVEVTADEKKVVKAFAEMSGVEYEPSDSEEEDSDEEDSDGEEGGSANGGKEAEAGAGSGSAARDAAVSLLRDAFDRGDDPMTMESKAKAAAESAHAGGAEDDDAVEGVGESGIVKHDMSRDEAVAALKASRTKADLALVELNEEYHRRARKLAAEHKKAVEEERERMVAMATAKVKHSQAQVAEAAQKLTAARQRLVERSHARHDEVNAMHLEVQKRIDEAAEAQRATAAASKVERK